MWKNYLKIALRNFRRYTSYSFINVLGLALGIACGITIFSILKHHLSFDDFHADSERIYRIVTEQHRDQISYRSSVPNPFGKVFRDDYTFGEKIARICTFDDQIIAFENNNGVTKFKEKEVAFAEEEFFEIFNYPLIQGNHLTALADPNSAIITENVAKKYFGDGDPINKTFRLDNRLDFKVTGVLKNIPDNTDRTTEIYLSYGSLNDYNEWFASDDSWGGISSQMQCFVKLRPGVTPAEVEQVFPAYVQKYRPNNKNVHHYKLQSLDDIHFNALYGGVMEKRNLWVLALIGFFLILTACINFINLATAQAINRSREVGVRKFLGSNRRQVFWQFIFETAIITITATILAAVISTVSFPYVSGWFNFNTILLIGFEWNMLLFILLLVVVVTFLAGAYPGLILSGFKPAAALKGKVSQLSTGGFNLRRGLIVTQFTICQVLIIGLIVIVYQMQLMKQSDLGFDKDAIIMIPIGSQDEKMNSLKNRFLQIAGVEKIALCYAAPAALSSWKTSLRFENRIEEEAFPINFRGGDDQYLSTFDLRLVVGRNLYPSDTVKEFLVNETFVKKLNLTSPEAVLGSTLLAGGELSGQVVGVVRDFHDQSFHEEINAVVISTNKDQYYHYAVKVNISDLKNTLASLDNLWSQTYPDQVYEYAFLDEQIEAFYASEDNMQKLIQTFSLVAIFIGCVGLYGMVSFMAARKTKEMGIRKILGGSVVQIFWIFGKEFTWLVMLSFLVAAPISWWLMKRWLQNFQYQIEISIWFFILAVLATSLVALITVGHQSLKAALRNPVESLRTE